MIVVKRNIELLEEQRRQEVAAIRRAAAEARAQPVRASTATRSFSKSR